MGDVDWQHLALAGFVLSVLTGSIVVLRARRGAEQVVMLVGAVFQVLGVATLLFSLLFWDGHAMSSTGLDSYLVLAQVSNIMLFIGLLAFAYGFVKFSLSYSASRGRADELERLVRRLEEDMRKDS